MTTVLVIARQARSLGCDAPSQGSPAPPSGDATVAEVEALPARRRSHAGISTKRYTMRLAATQTGV